MSDESLDFFRGDSRFGHSQDEFASARRERRRGSLSVTKRRTTTGAMGHEEVVVEDASDADVQAKRAQMMVRPGVGPPRARPAPSPPISRASTTRKGRHLPRHRAHARPPRWSAPSLPSTRDRTGYAASRRPAARTWRLAARRRATRRTRARTCDRSSRASRRIATRWRRDWTPRARSGDDTSKGVLDDLRALVATMEANTAEASYFLPSYERARARPPRSACASVSTPPPPRWRRAPSFPSRRKKGDARRGDAETPRACP